MAKCKWPILQMKCYYFVAYKTNLLGCSYNEIIHMFSKRFNIYIGVNHKGKLHLLMDIELLSLTQF